VAGAAVLVLTALPVHPDRVPAAEVDVFRAVNDTVTPPFVLVWVVMQLGNLVAVPAVALAAALARRFRLAVTVLVGGLLTYWLAKEVKVFVPRERPGSLLPDVVLRDAPAGGLGYVSGHAAVVVFLAVVVSPYLGRRGRWAAYLLAAVVCLTRVYVGAHLPLDVLGGAALGLALGGTARLVAGRPAP
jgi:membrane-associated phospholipid phosphatase